MIKEKDIIAALKEAKEQAGTQKKLGSTKEELLII